MEEKKIIYFNKPGKANTDACLDVVKKAIEDEGFKYVIIASTTGETGAKFSDALKDMGLNLIVVTHSAGFKEPNTHELTDENRKRILDNRATLFTGPMITHSLETAFGAQFGGSNLAQIVAQSLRRFGEGAKVCCECAMMATDGGLIPEGVEALVVAGTAYGADTVCVIKVAASKRFLNLKVQEILATPRA